MKRRKKELTFEPKCYYCGTMKDVTEKRTECIQPDPKISDKPVNVTVWCCKKCYELRAIGAIGNRGY